MKSSIRKDSSQKSPYLAFDSEGMVFAKDANTQAYVSKLKITNTSTEHVAVKIKTNAAEYYNVRPNSVVLKPSTAQELSIDSKHSLVPVYLIKSNRAQL